MFSQGNIDTWLPILKAKLPRITSLIFSTTEPLIYATLIELLGDSSKFFRKEGIIIPVSEKAQENITEVQARFTYRVPDFIGFTGNRQAIELDKEFILKRIRQVPGVVWSDTSVSISSKTGEIIVTFSVPVK